MIEPGEGAIEYARELTAGMNPEEAAALIATLRTHIPTDPKVKFCAVCAFPFRDKTKNGSSKVCGAWCKTTRKSEQKAIQRKHKAEDKQPKPKKLKKYDENSVMMRVWRHDKPFSQEKLDRINAERQRYERMGGRRKPVREIDY